MQIPFEFIGAVYRIRIGSYTLGGCCATLTQIPHMAGATGFEPVNVAVKGQCLTAWRRPNEERTMRPLYTLDFHSKQARLQQSP